MTILIFHINSFSQRILGKLIHVKINLYYLYKDKPSHKQSDNTLSFKFRLVCLLVRYKCTISLHPIFFNSICHNFLQTLELASKHSDFQF